MDDGSAFSRAGEGRCPVPDAVWDAVREDFLAGLSGPECCQRHGVGLTSLRKRAASEGWRRIDQPWRVATDPDINDEGKILEDEVCGDLDEIGPRTLSWLAERRMTRAVLRGDAAGALRWRRVRAAMQVDEVEFQHWLDEELRAEDRARLIREAEAGEDAAAAPTATAVNAVNASHGVFRSREAGEADPA